MSDKKRVLIATSGSGGHIFPAEALAQKLLKLESQPEVLFAGGDLEANRFFEHSKYPYQNISSAALNFQKPIKCIKGLGTLFKGFLQSLKLMRKYKPQVVIGFGTIHTIPLLLAAKLNKIPVILHVADSVPGKANKFFSPWADYVGITFPTAATYLKGEIVEVSMCLRDQYKAHDIDKIEACHYFDLSENKKTLLVFGGSQGANALNNLLINLATDLAQFQIIHLTGQEQATEQLKKMYSELNIKAVVKTFEKRMELAWKAADLFIGRSGASTIAEAIEFEVPGILIPYPYAADDHQNKNADYFEKVIKAGKKILQSKIDAIEFKKLFIIFSTDMNLENYKENIRTYKKIPKLDLCQVVMSVI